MAAILGNPGKCKPSLEMCRLWRLTGNHSAVDTLSLTKSSQSREETLRVGGLCRIFDHLHVYLMSISPYAFVIGLTNTRRA